MLLSIVAQFNLKGPKGMTAPPAAAVMDQQLHLHLELNTGLKGHPSPADRTPVCRYQHSHSPAALTELFTQQSGWTNHCREANPSPAVRAHARKYLRVKAQAFADHDVGSEVGPFDKKCSKL